ncbi:MAG: trehalose-6-phosphate synthase [Candidatus Nanopelagicales bacterium]|nr:trehalose-6-phosphate synthase [Candidatus Nanopelagicales bacterium]
MTESALKLGVLSRRAPIGHTADLTATLEHVGGLTRVLPALAEFADIDWTALTAKSQLPLPKHYSFSEISNQVHQHDINVFLVEVDHQQLEMGDRFCARYIWPLLHDLHVPEITNEDLDQHFKAILSTSREMATACVDINNDGYFVNDFQLSQVPTTLRELDSNKPLTFFLHTPWPKSIPRDSNAIKILKFLATGMLSADVIEFQTQTDLQEFEIFVLTHLPLGLANVALEVNPVSVDVQALQDQALCVDSSTQLLADEVSYVHIARSDPVKNTLATISAFTELAKDFKESMPRSYLDLYLVPSRQQWPEYQSLLAQITECVEINNAKLGSLNYIPIRLHVGNDYQRASHALTRFDYLIACSVADGLNLVVKEGAVLNNRNGVIVSTKNVGAMAELGDFCIVAGEANAMGITEALIKARSLSFESRNKMSFEQKRQIQEFDLSFWAKSVVANFKILEKV